MIKALIGLLVGAGIGFAGGYYYLENIYKEKLKSVEAEHESTVQELSACIEQKGKAEKQFQEADAELKLNENRSCFVTSAILEAPEFIPADIESFTSNSNGDVVLSWNPVKGAKKYIVTVESEDGTVVNTSEVEGETTLLLNRITNASKLAAAQYFVRIATVNGLDKEGPQSERKPIHFASQSFKATPKPTKTTKTKAKPSKKKH
jgi:hypothetical protein